MAGFLNALSFLAPIGESLGGTMHQADVRQQQQDQRTAYGKLLEGLGPEYKGVQEAFNAGASIHDINGFIGGPLGKELQQRHQSEQLAGIFQNPEDYRDPNKLRQAYAQGLLPESVGAKLFGDTDTPKSEYERYIQDQLGMSLEGYRALPQEVRDKDYQTFLDQTKKKQGAQPIGDKSTGDPGLDAWLAKNSAYRQTTIDKALAQYKKETTLNSQERVSLDQANEVLPELQAMEQSADAILPDKPGAGAYAATWRRWYQAKTGDDPRINEFESRRSAMITYLRSLAGTTRINQPEMELALAGMRDAPTKESFRKATDAAIETVRRIQAVLQYRERGPMGGDEANWSGTGFDGALNSSTEGASTGFESEP